MFAISERSTVRDGARPAMGSQKANAIRSVAFTLKIRKNGDRRRSIAEEIDRVGYPSKIKAALALAAKLLYLLLCHVSPNWHLR